MVRPTRILARLSALAVALAATLLAPVTAAAAPANDDFGGAIAIGGLPYTNTEDVSFAATAGDDPFFGCPNAGSVWYSFTPVSSGTAIINTFNSNYTAIPSVWTGSQGALSQVACSFSQSVQFTASAGTTYWIMVGQCCFNFGTMFPGASLTLNVTGPPPNDNFANATQVAALPFSDRPDTALATVEPGEPSAVCANMTGTVWYSFTPSTTQSITGTISNSFFGNTVLSAYTGSALATLTSVGCAFSNQPLTFKATAGQTYYFQVSGAFGFSGPMTFNLIVTPPPQVFFGYSPSDPSIFDNVQFFDETFDPGGVGLYSESWTFGDGGTGVTCCPTHTFAKDGTYNVTATATTQDGRTGSVTIPVTVKTHDVGIVKFTTPNTAKAGTTKAITVTVQSFRYTETVEVDLYSSVPGGFQLVGTLTNVVTVGANKAVNFDFSYSFTGPCPTGFASGVRCGDSTVGSVTFMAVAQVVGARDALPGNNTATSIATTVK